MSFLESIFYMAWRGIAIGLIISAPMGPVGMLCIQRTLDKGRRAGFFTGVGAAISDLFYSLLTGFGLSFIEEFLEKNQNVIQLVGSGVLIAFGIYLFRNNPTKGLKKPVEGHISVQKSILGGFLFTFSNPLILFLIIGLFARFNFLVLHPTADPVSGIIYLVIGYAGIYAGAILWWWLITFSVDKVRSHFNLRSMWLINKIIGVIILLFAIVGIITATVALAEAGDVRCWNTRNGLGVFSSDEKFITNEKEDSLYVMVGCGAADGLEFRSKVNNHKTKVPWGYVIKGTNGETIHLDILTGESAFDGVATSQTLITRMRVEADETAANVFSDSTSLLEKLKSGISGPDPSGSLNFFKIVTLNDQLSFFGGIHTPQLLLSESLPKGFKADSIGFYLCPGSKMELDELRLTTSRVESTFSPWSDMELLEQYLAASVDPMEGYLATMDRSLDETLLRLGGDYRYAMVRSDNGYDLIYLLGAKINSDNWHSGMIKARLRPSGITGVWNVEWIDAMHQPLSNELKAQKDKDGVLTIQFPYHNSHIRLFRCDTPR